MAYVRCGQVKVDDLVVVAGAVEMAAALEELQKNN